MHALACMQMDATACYERQVCSLPTGHIETLNRAAGEVLMQVHAARVVFVLPELAAVTAFT